MIGEAATIVTGMTTSRIATHGAGEGPIFGRERELSQLYGLVDRVQERGAALLVRGEEGIGKSTLLAAAGRRAEDVGMQVLHATGVQSETQLPFAGLHQLMLPVLGEVDRLPAPQRTALLAAFGMTEEEAPDRFLIALAVLELLSEVAERVPLVVVADDAHWFDSSTAGVLAFVARRVEHEPIVVLVASRPRHHRPHPRLLDDPPQLGEVGRALPPRKDGHRLQGVRGTLPLHRRTGRLGGGRRLRPGMGH